MGFSRFVLSPAVVIAAVTGVAHADVVYQSASRSTVSAFQFPTFGDNQSMSFDGFGMWVGGGPVVSPVGTVAATVSQASLLHPLLIDFTGTAMALAHPFQGTSAIFAAAESHMNVGFTVTTATPYEFTATWNTIGTGAWPLAGFPYIALYYGAEKDEIILVPIQVSTTGQTLEDTVLISGILEPGDYLLDAAVFAHAASGTDWDDAVSGFNAFAQFQLAFIPAPGALALFAIAGVLRRRRR